MHRRTVVYFPDTPFCAASAMVDSTPRSPRPDNSKFGFYHSCNILHSPFVVATMSRVYVSRLDFHQFQIFSGLQSKTDAVVLYVIDIFYNFCCCTKTGNENCIDESMGDYLMSLNHDRENAITTAIRSDTSSRFFDQIPQSACLRATYVTEKRNFSRVDR